MNKFKKKFQMSNSNIYKKFQSEKLSNILSVQIILKNKKINGDN